MDLLYPPLTAFSSTPTSSALFAEPDAPKDLAMSLLTDPISVDLWRCGVMLPAIVDDRCCESYSDKSDCDMVPKLSGFDLSKIVDGDFGTRGYLSPDYMEPTLRTRSDVYSLGVVILKILIGNPTDRYYGTSRVSVDDDRPHDWMPNGMTSLNIFLYTREPALQPDCSSYMSWATRYKIIKGICQGLNNLHMGIKHSIIHLDLKPSQILQDRDMVPKQLCYMAPEYTEEAAERMAIIMDIMLSHQKDRLRFSRCDDYIQDCWAKDMTSLDLHPRDPALQLDCFSYMSWATTYKIIKGICEGLNNLHMGIKHPLICLDLKPTNILPVPEFTFSQILMLSLGDVEIPVSAASTQNSLSDVDFTVAASAKGDTEIKIGYHVRHLLKYLGVHHPLFHMVLFAHKKFVDALKSVAPKGILYMAKRLSSSALLNVCKANWISAISELLMVETINEYNTGRSVGSRKEPTHSVPDACAAEHGIKEWKPKTSTAWVVSTAAPHHATGNRNILSGFVTEHDDQFVHALDGVPMKVLARGAVVTDAVVLPDVWFVPGLTANLVSVSQLAELGYSVRFDSSECYIRSAAHGMILGKAHLQEGGLYVLDFLKVSLAM